MGSFNDISASIYLPHKSPVWPPHLPPQPQIYSKHCRLQPTFSSRVTNVDYYIMFNRRSIVPEPVLEQSAGLVVKQADLGTTANGDSPPPSYMASTAKEPPPDISTAFANLNLCEPSALAQTPTPDECLAHLKLLEAFYSLRQDISQHDGLFGINDSFATASTEQERTQELARIREKRWQVYVSKANKRFEAWWTTCVLPGAQRQSQYAVTLVGQTPWVGEKLNFERENLPPLGNQKFRKSWSMSITNHLCRCRHGLACISA